jgi:alcohol dehydrogenase
LARQVIEIQFALPVQYRRMRNINVHHNFDSEVNKYRSIEKRQIVMEQKTMKAFVFRGVDDYGLQDMPVPQIVKPDDAIVKVTVNAICTSDVHIVHGGIPQITDSLAKNGPRILGHEFCGEVVEAGTEVSKFKVGDRVIVLAGIGCFECPMCKIGMRASCATLGMFGGTNLHGAQAEYVRIPKANITMIKIPEGLTEEDVLFLPDMLATGWFGLKNANFSEGQTAAVIGLGPVGQCTAMLAKKAFGAKTVVVFDLIQERLDAALKAGVADYAINVGTDDIRAKVAEITGGAGFNATIDTPGTQESLNLACAITGINGVLSTIAIVEKPVTLPMQQLCFKNVTIKMGIQHLEGMAEMLKMIVAGNLDTKYIQTHRSPLNDIEKAYKIFENREDGCIKWLIYPYER